MAVVVYQCDTCKRDIHRKQNRAGLDVISHCVITNGCRGKLILKAIKPSYAIGHSTPPIIGLTDWTPRKVLHTHTQGFLKKEWEIVHGLNNHPSISAYIHKGEQLVRVDPDNVEFVSNDAVRLTFSTAVTGIAQCQARSASDGQNITTLAPINTKGVIDSTVFDTSRSFVLTNGAESGEITIATRVATISNPDAIDPKKPLTIRMSFLSPTDLSVNKEIDLTFRDVNNSPVNLLMSPWANTKYAMINGHRYLIRSANIHTTTGSWNTLTQQGVPQGAACYFTVMDQTSGTPKALKEGDIFILNAIEPYTSADRNYNQVTDMKDINQSTATASASYIGLDVSVNTALLKDIFPSILLL